MTPRDDKEFNNWYNCKFKRMKWEDWPETSKVEIIAWFKEETATGGNQEGGEASD